MYAAASDHNNTETQRFRSQQQQQQPPPPSFFFFFFLAEELITEILSWLPLESLIRFKCVSKSWNSLISNPSFIQLHFHRSPKLPPRRFILLRNFQDITTWRTECVAASYASFATLTHFLLNPSSCRSSSDQQRLLRLNGRYTILGSCNGLVCLLFCSFHEDSHFFIWNPATRLVSQKLPGFPPANPPANFDYKFGFGYDKKSDTYKLVALRCSLLATQVKVYTFASGSASSGGHCWREIHRFPEYPFYCQVEGIFLSGTLNWLAMRNIVTGPGNVINWHNITLDKCVIVSLDLGDETYKQFSMPPFRRDELPDNPAMFNPVMEVSLDCLCLSYDCDRTRFIMWQMKEFGVEKSWTCLVNISYQQHQIETVGYLFIEPLCISENGDTLILRKNFDKILVFNRRDNGVQLASTIRDEGLEIYVKGYAPSLISPC